MPRAGLRRHIAYHVAAMDDGSEVERSSRRRDDGIWRDVLVCATLVTGTFALYLATLFPGIGYGDSAELQRVVPTLKLAHVTGYPLYTLLGWL